MKRAGTTADRARDGIVLLHGRGGSAAEILGLMQALALPQVSAIAPEAPGNSWWPTSFLAPAALLDPFVAAGLAATREAVALLQADGLPRRRIWLCGFSQGACLALEAFARQGDGLAGVFALSGGLIGTHDAPGGPQADLYGHTPKDFAYSSRRDGARVRISVHAHDPHIPLARVMRSADVLTGLGAQVETVVHPGAGHGIVQPDIAALRASLSTAPD